MLSIAIVHRTLSIPLYIEHDHPDHLVWAGFV